MTIICKFLPPMTFSVHPKSVRTLILNDMIHWTWGYQSRLCIPPQSHTRYPRQTLHHPPFYAIYKSYPAQHKRGKMNYSIHVHQWVFQFKQHWRWVQLLEVYIASIHLEKLWTQGISRSERWIWCSQFFSSLTNIKSTWVLVTESDGIPISWTAFTACQRKHSNWTVFFVKAGCSEIQIVNMSSMHIQNIMNWLEVDYWTSTLTLYFGGWEPSSAQNCL